MSGNDKSYTNPPLEEGDKLGRLRSSELHRLLKEYRWVYTVFSQIAGRASLRVKAIQSILMKRGEPVKGKATPPGDHMKHPLPSDDISITDHALVRYLARVKGIDVVAVEDEMIERIRNGQTYFAGAVVVDDDNNSYVLRNDGLVVSVMPEGWMTEADGVAAEHALRRGKQERKDTHYRALAAQGLDTSPRVKEDGREHAGS